MPKKPNLPPDAAEVRRRAEDRQQAQPSRTAAARPEADTQRVVHELQVHQIELEIQNEELQKARVELEAALEKYSDLYDFAPVGYVTFDRAGMIEEANLAAASLLGIERSRLVRRRFAPYVSAADQPAFTAFLAKVFETKGKESCELTLRLDGKPSIQVRIEAVVATSGQECRAVLEDITGQKQAEGDRLILNKLESTGILAGGIAHDFNNLLTVILLDLDQARALAPAGTPLAHPLEGARTAVMAARGLTQQLITFAKGGAPARKPTRLPRVIEESVRLPLSGSRVRCEFSMADELWPAEVDAGQVGQLFRNLALNAREAMPEGGILSIRVENVVLESQASPSLPPGNYVRVSMADQGVGIAKEVLPKIFDPYFSTKQRGTEKGMGLGLTICHTVIQKHGGAITVESKLGVGTTFHIYLPACRKLPRERKTSVATIPPKPGKILVMDDEEGVRKVVGLLLRRMGHQVELVEDGQRAIEVYGDAKRQGCPFDVVILDLTVRAGLGGQEAMQALLKVDPKVKAIVTSGYANDPVVLEPERYGFADVLEKPFVGDSLREVLAQVMGNGPSSIVAP